MIETQKMTHFSFVSNKKNRDLMTMLRIIATTFEQLLLRKILKVVKVLCPWEMYV